MNRRRRTAASLLCAASLFALAGCGYGQPFGPDCPLFDHDVILTVTVLSERTIDDVGICDESACSTDDDIPEGSNALQVHQYHVVGEDEWSFSVIGWMPEAAGFVAIVDGEEVDLGWHELEQGIEYPFGERCGSIASYEPLTFKI